MDAIGIAIHPEDLCNYLDELINRLMQVKGNLYGLVMEPQEAAIAELVLSVIDNPDVNIEPAAKRALIVLDIVGKAHLGKSLVSLVARID